jgi:hypothetical protein
MPGTFSIKLRGAAKVAKSIKKRNDIAAFRAVNKLEKRAQKEVGKAVRDIYPVKQKDIKKALKVTKAKLISPIARWALSSKRLPLPKAKGILRGKGGIAFTGLQKNRHKLTEPIDGGTRPFMIQGRYSGKLIPVYVAPEDMNNRTGRNRTRPVKTLKGHSIPFLFDKVESMKIIRKLFKLTFMIEYKKQLKRAKF